MTPEERDILVEVRNDVRWLKNEHEEHKRQHSNYFYYFITLIVGVFVSLIESFRR